jgi:hypothetical protein
LRLCAFFIEVLRHCLNLNRIDYEKQSAEKNPPATAPAGGPAD